MRRRQWVREGDLIVIQPWEFQDEKANVCMRYTKTQSLYLSRKGVLPEIVDMFGMSTDDSSNIGNSEEESSEEDQGLEDEADTEITKESPEPVVDDDDIDSFFG